MAEIIIRLRKNPESGKRELIIDYESDDDMLAHEHERDHRALAEKLLGQKLGVDIDGVHIRRVQPNGHLEETKQTEAPTTQREATKVGG